MKMVLLVSVVRSLLTILVAAGCAWGAEGIDPRVRAALDAANALRVEFAADLIFQILDSGKVPKDIAIEYLERLYGRSGEAKAQNSLLLAPRRVPAVDQGHRLVAQMSESGIDSPNMGARVLKRLAPLDKRRAEILFAAARPQPIPSLAGCEEPTVPYRGRMYYPELWRALPDSREDLVRRATTVQDLAGVLGVAVSEPDDSIRAFAFRHIAALLPAVTGSYRVFTVVESNLGFGKQLEDALGRDVVPPDLKVVLAIAYAAYVERHLKRERCADVPLRDGEDAIARVAMDRVKRLSEKFGFPPPDLARIEARISSKEPPAFSTSPETELDSLAALATKLKNGGSPDVAAQFSTELQSYIQRGSAPSAALYDTAARPAMLVMLVSKLDVDEVTNVAVPAIVRLLEGPRLLEAAPAVWFLLARQVLNMTLHASPAISARTRDSLQRSSDINVSTYYSLQREIGLVKKFDANPLGMTVLGAY